jgi:hypothetical protein
MALPLVTGGALCVDIALDDGLDETIQYFRKTLAS